MAESNYIIVNRFFELYNKRDFNGIREVMSDDVIWTFLGQHPVAGVKRGFEEVIALFDTMSGIMGMSNVKAEKLVTGENDNYLVECQHVWTNREDGMNIDHYVCVLWTFENGKIVSGRHFFSDPKTADHFFNKMINKDKIE